MTFEWDTHKNQLNIRKHGIDFTDVPEMFDYPMLVMIDDREDYVEDRWIGIGLLKHVVAVVVFVERHDDVIRIISARKATYYESKTYQEELAHRLGKT